MENLDERGEEATLVQKICEIYHSISNLPTLKPSKDVNALFTKLVITCIPPSSIDVARLPMEVQIIRSKLIRLCGEAEGHLESHYSTFLGSLESPVDHLALFPYYTNYLKLGLLEHNILSNHYSDNSVPPSRIAFVGSGPLPLTSIVLAKYHLKSTTFHNYDINPSANALATRLVASDPDLSRRMVFHTTDIMDVTLGLRDYDVVFLAALVGMSKEEKATVLAHLAKYMAPGALLMVRSAAGARAFLYPVVDQGDLGSDFDVLQEFHPADDVINSVVIAKKVQIGAQHQHQNHHGNGVPLGQGIIMPCKCCSKMENFHHGSMMEDLPLEEQAS